MKTETVVITGAGTGIGRALAHVFAAKGHAVLGAGRRIEPLQEARSAYPDSIRVVSADVSSTDGRQAIAGALEGAKVKYLIQNAAVLGPVLPLVEMDEEGWRRHMEINVNGPLFLTKTLLPFMESGSRILHISSGAAHNAYHGWGAYCTSKAAFNMIYRALDLELKDRGIRVGSVRPGVVDTPMQDAVRQTPFEHFPDLPRFVELKKSGALFAPKTTAGYIYNLLTTKSDEKYAGKEWDIRE